MKVNIDDLEKVLFSLLEELRDKKGCEIELDNDHYWDIDNEELYNPYEKPKNITLGQIADDLEEINRLNKAPDEAIPYDLQRIAVILKALSIENSTAF